MARIFLIGFMGAGKSTLGKQLAELLTSPFFDFDLLLEEKEKTSIASLLRSKGEKEFRSLEEKYLKSFPFPEDVVVACGGGTPCFHHNIEWMNRRGITIYLRAEVTTLHKRLSKDSSTRPLLDEAGDDLAGFIKSKLEERETFYSQAKFIADVETTSAPILVTELRKNQIDL